MGPRDRYIGWDEATRILMLPHVINSNRMETVPKLLAEHLATFTPYLGRSEQKKHFTTLIQGRLSDLDRKSNEPVAIAFSLRIHKVLNERNLAACTG